MILSIFIFLFCIATVFLIIGWVWKADAFKYVAFSIMFILGSAMLFNQLQYESGTNISLVGSAYVVTPVYTTLSEHTTAFLITMSSAVGFIFTLVDRRKESEEDYDAE